MTDTSPRDPAARHHWNGTILIVGAVMVTGAAAVAALGAVLSGTALFNAARRWLHEHEEAPVELAQQKWAQTRAATSAAVHAWHDNTPVRSRLHPQRDTVA
ncbi:hypothetical protein HII36_34200 [Nonomuraea sp. NN258]|uniref:hypothetical protein n=1 Tax=Nonomuraea antri TaxID=2730852 RepID=UPI0015680977|nr:hypothetical protein [Nonomuraea antri]NRQ36855.1 hypothetical protein [Nonomuraea antri]